MKKISLKIAVAALLFAVGTLGLSAQGMRGGGNHGGGMGGGNGMGGTCTGTNLSKLTDAQKTELQALNTAFQAEMAGLVTKRQAATTLADKLAIFAEMNDLRNKHLADVKALFDSWGIAVTTGNGTRGSGLMGTGKHGRRG